MTATSATTTAPPPREADLLWAAFQPLPLEDLARRCGFLRRRPKKVQPGAFLQLCCLLALQTQVSLRAWACLWGLLTQQTLSKQAMAKRCSAAAVAFVRNVLELLLGRLCTPAAEVPAALRSFGRVLLQDSTTLALDPKLAARFPGPRNHCPQAFAALKIQVFYDLLSQRCLHFWLTPFTTNDQKASATILRLARRGDLFIRDLGYLLLGVLAQAQERGIFFLSRWRQGITVWEPGRSTPLDLLAHLRRVGTWDAPVLLGQKERLPARLIALPLPPAIAAERRRKALANRDRRSRPCPQRLALLDWEIFLTNVPVSVWSPRQVAETYRLRWRIEILFKAWKSHFRLAHFTNGSAPQIELLVYGRLLWITLFHTAFVPPTALHATLSTLKLAAYCQDYLLFPLLLTFAGPLQPPILLQQMLYHCRAESRRRPPRTSASPSLLS